MGKHDHTYKILFSHPRMVRDLLDGFVSGDWRAQLDFDTLQRVSDNYVSDDLRARADDIVWRVRCGGHDVYLLLEFQSTNEPFMALRVLAYEALLFQDIQRHRNLKSSDELPAILPIVLYNGCHCWSAHKDLASSFPSSIPEGLAGYVPQCRYLLIDESRYEEADLRLEENAVAALFRLEKCRRPEQIAAIVSSLMTWLERTGQRSLRRAFRIWLGKVLFARFGKGTAIVNDLWEEQTMLSERLDQWEAEFLQRGRQAGWQEGLQKGLQEGRQDGEVALLMRLLRKRFGELPPSVSDRLKLAQPAQLERWGDRLLDARSLSELLD
jgi:predicted transposase YdaD